MLCVNEQLVENIVNTGADLEFSDRGHQPTYKYYSANISQKLHENEENWVRAGGAFKMCPY